MIRSAAKAPVPVPVPDAVPVPDGVPEPPAALNGHEHAPAELFAEDVAAGRCRASAASAQGCTSARTGQHRCRRTCGISRREVRRPEPGTLGSPVRAKPLATTHSAPALPGQ
jgi:hypothetical protein